jgi:multiple sugar transport system permease protein
MKPRYEKIVYVGPVIGFLLVVGIFPLVYSFALLFSSVSLASGSFTFIGLANFARLLTDTTFQGSLITTGRFALEALVLEFLIGFALALAVREITKGRRLITTILILPMAMTPIAVGLIWKEMYDIQFGPVNYLLSVSGIIANPIDWLGSQQNALTSLVIMDTWHWSCFVFVILLAGLQAMPREPFEAAIIDGASTWQTFRHLTIRFLRVPITIVLLIRGIDLLKAVDEVYVMTGGGPGVSTELYTLYSYYVGFRYFDLGYAATLSYVLLVIITVITTIFLNYALRSEE